MSEAPEREFTGGWATTLDGRRVPLSAVEAKAIYDRAAQNDARRRYMMPDSMAALQMLFDVRTRLKDEGWRDGIYCPKDGSAFAVIEYGSTGIFTGFYSGKWPKGHVISGDCANNPQGIMWKPLDGLTEAEAAKLKECDEAERIMMNRMLESFAEIDGDEGDE